MAVEEPAFLAPNGVVYLLAWWSPQGPDVLLEYDPAGNCFRLLGETPAGADLDLRATANQARPGQACGATRPSAGWE